MAIDAKMSFLGQIERKFSEKLTAMDMGICLGIISDVLEMFDMRENFRTCDDTPDDLLDSFVASMQIQGKSPQTIDRYVYVIGRFMKFAKVPTRRINVYHIRNWLQAEKQRGIADSTLEGNRQVLSSYFGWLFRESLIEKNPVANVGVIKVAKKKKLTYTDIEMEKLNQNCKTIRDKAILHFLASTGCRVSEMTGLNRDTVNLKTLECVVHGKGNKERTVYIDSVTGMLLEKYLANRKDDNEALFVGRLKERLKPGGVRIMLNTLAKLAGVQHCHPHKFRRTLATEMARRGMPIHEVSHYLGHESLDTTMTYVNINDDDMRHDYMRYA